MKYIQIIDRNGQIAIIFIAITYFVNVAHMLYPDYPRPDKMAPFNLINLICPLIAVFFMFGMMNTGWNIETRRVDPYGTISETDS